MYRVVVALLALLSCHIALPADRTCLPEGASMPASWTAPFPAHRIIGPLYAVGGADLGVFLITTSEGHVLVNTGLEDSLPAIRQNIEDLGFRFEDVRVLLSMQAHFDHTGALAEAKRVTGAELWATDRDARILADGGRSDPHFGECLEFRFAPVEPDRLLRDGEVIELGGLAITVHLHPGHTEGSSSYSFVHREHDRDYNVLIANMGTINDGKRLVNEPTYAGVAGDFAMTYRKQKALRVDAWVAAHASHYHRDDKYTPGDPYDPDTFVDPAGFVAEVTKLEQIYLQQLADEQRVPGH